MGTFTFSGPTLLKRLVLACSQRGIEIKRAWINTNHDTHEERIFVERSDGAIVSRATPDTYLMPCSKERADEFWSSFWPQIVPPEPPKPIKPRPKASTRHHLQRRGPQRIIPN